MYNVIICKVRQFLPLHSLKTLYNSLILPDLSYGAMIWADSNNSNLDLVFLLKKKVSSALVQSPSGLHTLIHFSHPFLLSRFRTSINFNWLLLCINFTSNYFHLISLATISSMLILHLTSMIQGTHTSPSLHQITLSLPAIPPNLRACNYCFNYQLF